MKSLSIKWVHLAALNIIRHRRRTLMAALIIACGSASILVAFGYMLATFWGLQEVTIRGELGHIQIAKPGSFDEAEEVPLSNGLDQALFADLTNVINAKPETRNLLKRVMFDGLVATDKKTTIFLGTAVEPEKEQALAGFALPIIAGKALPSSTSLEDPMQVLLAIELARNLQVEAGDIVTILSTTSYGALNAVDVKVSGIYQTGIPELDKRALLVPLPVAEMLLQSDKISRMVVHLKHTQDTQNMLNDLNKQYGELEIRDWQSLAPFYNKVKTLYNGIFFVMGIIILLVVLLSVTNTMLMSVMERVREIGTMRAFGISAIQLRWNFWLEGSLTGAIGGLLGLVIAAFIAFIINDLEIMLPPPPGRTMEVPLLIFIDASLYGAILLIMILLGGLATWFPTRHILKLNIIEALGHD